MLMSHRRLVAALVIFIVSIVPATGQDRASPTNYEPRDASLRVLWRPIAWPQLWALDDGTITSGYIFTDDINAYPVPTGTDLFIYGVGSDPAYIRSDLGYWGGTGAFFLEENANISDGERKYSYTAARDDGDLDFLLNGDFSISGVARYQSSSGAIFSWGDSQAAYANEFLQLYVDGASQRLIAGFRGAVEGPNNLTVASPSGSIAPNVFFSYTLVRDFGNEVRLYLNGKRVATGADVVGVINPVGHRFMMAASSSNGSVNESALSNYFYGAIGSTALWSIALSDLQVYDNYRFQSNVLAVDDFEDDPLLLASDEVATLPVLNNDVGFSSPSLSISMQAEHGTAQVEPNGTISYAPNENYTGLDSFQYRVYDGEIFDTAWAYVKVTEPSIAPTKFTKQGSSGIVISDINGNDHPEFAVFRDPLPLVEIRDTSSGNFIKYISFLNNNMRPLAIVRLDDLNGNGSNEIGILAQRGFPVGRIRFAMRDSLTGERIGAPFTFFDDSHEWIGIDVVRDFSDNGIPEIGLLAVHQVSGEAVVSVRDALSGEEIASNPVRLLGDDKALAIFALADTNSDGIDEFALFGVGDMASNSYMRARNADGSGSHFQRTFLKGYVPFEVVPGHDIDSDGSIEVAVVGQRESDGRMLLEIKDTIGTPDTVRIPIVFNKNYRVAGLSAIPDLDGDTNLEYGVVSTRLSDSRSLVSVVNGAGLPNKRKRTFLANGFSETSLVPIFGKSGTVQSELGLFGERRSDGRAKLEFKHFEGAANLRGIWFKPRPEDDLYDEPPSFSMDRISSSPLGQVILSLDRVVEDSQYFVDIDLGAGISASVPVQPDSSGQIEIAAPFATFSSLSDISLNGDVSVSISREFNGFRSESSPQILAIARNVDDYSISSPSLSLLLASDLIIQGSIEDLRFLEDEADGSLSVAEEIAELENIRAAIDEIGQCIESIENDAANSCVFGSVNGETIVLDSTQLLQLDRISSELIASLMPELLPAQLNANNEYLLSSSSVDDQFVRDLSAALGDESRLSTKRARAIIGLTLTAVGTAAVLYGSSVAAPIAVASILAFVTATNVGGAIGAILDGAPSAILDGQSSVEEFADTFEFFKDSYRELAESIFLSSVARDMLGDRVGTVVSNGVSAAQQLGTLLSDKVPPLFAGGIFPSEGYSRSFFSLQLVFQDNAGANYSCELISEPPAPFEEIEGSVNSSRGGSQYGDFTATLDQYGTWRSGCGSNIYYCDETHDWSFKHSGGTATAFGSLLGADIYPNCL